MIAPPEIIQVYVGQLGNDGVDRGLSNT